jgi:hypothetical protein
MDYLSYTSSKEKALCIWTMMAIVLAFILSITIITLISTVVKSSTHSLPHQEVLRVISWIRTLKSKPDIQNVMDSTKSGGNPGTS